MLEFWQYDFMQRALAAGLVVGAVSPALGTFLVVRRQALIGDGLGHIAFAGVAASWLIGLSPLLGALAFTMTAALGIEGLRRRAPGYADTVLGIFFYGGMALAAVFSSLGRASNVNLLSFLFGSILTVSPRDLGLIALLGSLSMGALLFFYRELVSIAFDEETARVGGLPVDCLNLLLALLTAATVSIAMRVVGLLLVAALMVIPVATALRTARSFRALFWQSILWGEISVAAGLIASFYLNLASGGSIVLAAGALFTLALLRRRP